MTLRNFSLWTAILATLLSFSLAAAQEISQHQHWLELAAADQTFSDRSGEIGRNRAFLEFLGKDSIVFRSGRGPIDALEEYTSQTFQNVLSWKAHYIDVSRDGNLGLSAGPISSFNPSSESDQETFFHQVLVWKKNEGRWELMADMFVDIPGFLSLDVEPNFDDTRPVLEETAHPIMAMAENNTLQSLIDADNTFGRNINFRGGQRALLAYGMDNARVYLPGMAPAVGAEAASSVYGAFLDNQLFTTNPISLTYEGGYISTSKEMGYTYGTMATNTDETEQGFEASYLRLWRFTDSNEWKIAVEVLRPFNN